DGLLSVVIKPTVTHTAPHPTPIPYNTLAAVSFQPKSTLIRSPPMPISHPRRSARCEDQLASPHLLQNSSLLGLPFVFVRRGGYQGCPEIWRVLLAKTQADFPASPGAAL